MCEPSGDRCGFHVMVREVGRCTFTLCMPIMRGARDMLAILIRLQPCWSTSLHAEINMND